MKGYAVRRKSGRGRNGAERDGGVIFHLVPDDLYPSWDDALCGVSPGIRGNGWDDPEEDQQATCPKCLKRLEKANDAV